MDDYDIVTVVADEVDRLECEYAGCGSHQMTLTMTMTVGMARSLRAHLTELLDQSTEEQDAHRHT